MYEAREQEDILAELQSESETSATKIEGTFEYDMLASNSIEFAKTEVELEQLYKACFADTSWGEYLTMIAEQYGVLRRAAAKATGTITLTGKGIVPTGSLFTTAAGTKFQTLEYRNVNGTADVPVEAVNAGEAGDVKENTITVIPMSIPGITAVTNAEATSGGYDEEDDEDLLKRYLEKVRLPATSGNKYEYYEWAKSVSGVGDARVQSLWNGPGTVKVIIVDANMQVAPASLIQSVADYIETVRPIGATVTVVSPTPIPVTITAKISGTLDKEQFLKDVNAYIAGKGMDLRSLSYARCIDILLNQTTVADCADVRLNGKELIECSADEMIRAEEVEVDEL
ncbi:baseplate J/gp47 family protein [uncultured Selenomonas sp.]|uniref:baseplate J/gp47 family protein n=1 Tax=uncultured Selenomonas sp. TaxID=159275 RepID=UPI0025E8DAE4|nr:baseplate J/gp47 family protein [uncultured Selenomonas sp.]